jgi:hypothetical protein
MKPIHDGIMEGFQTDQYFIDIGFDEEEKMKIYCVTNKLTGVVEYEDTILPRTLDAIKNLQQLYEEAVANFMKQPTLKVVSDKSKH